MKVNGKKVVDADAPLTINVTRRDIQNALTGNDQECAVARSLHRQSDILSVSVGALIVLVEKKDHYIRYQWSKEDARKIHDFDAAGYMRPMEWTLQPPHPARALGARAGSSGSATKTGRVRNVRNSPPLRHVRLPQS